jgi:hypothetical protein
MQARCNGGKRDRFRSKGKFAVISRAVSSLLAVAFLMAGASVQAALGVGEKVYGARSGARRYAWSVSHAAGICILLLILMQSTAGNAGRRPHAIDQNWTRLV